MSEETKCCGQHSGFESRLERAEKDIQVLFDKNEKKNTSSWQFVGTAALAFLSMAFNIVMIFVKG